MSDTSPDPSNQPALPSAPWHDGLSFKLATETAANVTRIDRRQAVSRESAALDSILFDPPYLCQPGVSYAVREFDGQAQIWEVEHSRNGAAWIAEAPRASAPPTFAQRTQIP